MESPVIIVKFKYNQQRKIQLWLSVLLLGLIVALFFISTKPASGILQVVIFSISVYLFASFTTIKKRGTQFELFDDKIKVVIYEKNQILRETTIKHSDIINTSFYKSIIPKQYSPIHTFDLYIKNESNRKVYIKTKNWMLSKKINNYFKSRGLI